MTVVTIVDDGEVKLYTLCMNVLYLKNVQDPKHSRLGHYVSICGNTLAFAANNVHKCQNTLKFVGKHSQIKQNP